MKKLMMFLIVLGCYSLSFGSDRSGAVTPPNQKICSPTIKELDRHLRDLKEEKRDLHYSLVTQEGKNTLLGQVIVWLDRGNQLELLKALVFPELDHNKIIPQLIRAKFDSIYNPNSRLKNTVLHS